MNSMQNYSVKSFARVGAAILGIFLGVQAYGGTLSWNAGQNSWWDTTSLNWYGSAYADGDTVIFGDPVPSGGSVNVSAIGVSPAEVEVLNTSGTYTISGGPIGGTGSLTKDNAGTLVLGSSNSYSGGTTVSGGMVIIEDGDASLGNSTGGVMLDGGELFIQSAPLVSSRSWTVTANGGVINTNGMQATINGAMDGPGYLTKIGAGDLAVQNSVGSSSSSLGLSVKGGSFTIDEAGSQYITTGTTAGNFAGSLNLAAGVNLEITGNTDTTAPSLIDGGGNVDILGSDVVIGMTGAVRIDNNIILNSQDKAQPFSTTFSAALSGSVSAQLEISGTISGASDVTFSANGYNNRPLVILDSPEIYTGNTYIGFVSTGALRLGVNNTLPVITELTFQGGSGAVDLNGYNQTLAGLAGASPNTTVANTGTTTSNLDIIQSINTSYVGAIGEPEFGNSNLAPRGPDLNNINFTKDGPGVLRLNGIDGYSGYTAIHGGALVVNGGLGGSGGGITNTSGVTVANGATLAGQGAVSVAPIIHL